MKFDVALGTSVVLMAFDGEQLVALIGEKSQEPYKGAPMLPSNWVSAGESVEEVAKRMLSRILGVDKVYLEQLNAFAKVYRNPMGRVVNIAYFALLNWDVVKEVKTPGYRWVSLADRPEMIFDHNEILEMAYERLKRRVKHRPIGFVMLPKQFTFNMIHSLYEQCLGKDLDKRNFRKKFMRSELLIDTEESVFEAPGNKKPSRLYEFNQQKYDKLTLKGYDFKF
jgi:8-oxo-dGTP diphosphatase